MKTATASRGVLARSALADIACDNQQLSDLIGDLYDAALDHSRWPYALAAAAEFVGGCGAGLFSKDAASRSGSLHYSIGIEPDHQKSYFDTFVALDPATTGHRFSEIEVPMATADLMSCRELTEGQLFRESARRQGLVDFVSVVLDRSATGVAMFGVFRDQRNGVVDAKARHRMQLIVPHIRRAVLIGRMFDQKAAEAATFADTLDGLIAAICVVSADARVIHANAAAKAIFGAGDILRIAGGRLVARDAQVHQALRGVFAAAGEAGAALGARGAALSLTGKDGVCYVAHALPLIFGARRRAGVAYSAVAALFVRKVSAVGSSSPEAIGKAFRLTPTEILVLLAIVDVGGVPEVAAALGVAATTIKTHLSRLFEKTGATRQADLVKLVAGFATPLVN